MSNCDDDEDCEGSGAGGTGNKHSVVIEATIS